ncbi:MAG: S8 family peptidase [Halobacteriales archaeon]
MTAKRSTTTFIVDTGDEVSQSDYLRVTRAGLKIKYDQDQIGYLVVEGSETDVKRLSYDYAPDVEMSLDAPETTVDATGVDLSEMAADAEGPVPDDGHIQPPANYAFQWDKQFFGLEELVEQVTGDGVTIAVIDTSMYYDHPDLSPNFNVADSMAVVEDGYGVFHPLGNDHGTHVAGIAAAASGGGVIGMAPEAEILGIRYFSPDVTGGAAEFTEAVMYAAENADVINTSLGFPPVLRNRENLEFFQDYYQAVDAYAIANDAVWVSSAGNDMSNATEDDLTIMPADLEYNLAISATGPIGFGYELFDGEDFDGIVSGPTTPANYTDHGRHYVDIAAPGGNYDPEMTEELPPGSDLPAYAYDLVFNAIFTMEGGEIAPGYGWKAGTSMSAPNVAGIAALIREANPDATAYQVQRLLKATADPSVGSPVYLGNGFVDPHAALEADLPDDRPGRGTTEGGRDDRSRDDVGIGRGDGGSGGESGRRYRGRSGGSPSRR